VWRGGTATIGPAQSSAFDGDDGDEFADPLAAAARFAAAFREAFGDGGPAWAVAPWASAADAASRAHRLCFVYLHAPRHDATEGFCRSTLCDPEVSRRLSRECVCWGGDVSRSAEAAALAGALGARAFPFAALLVRCSPADASSGASPSSRTATLAARAEGPVSAAELGRLLDAAAAEHGPALETARAAAAGRERDRALRAEQDAEFEAALLADQLKARERERAREAARAREEERAAREREVEAGEAAAAGRAAAAAAALGTRRAAARAALPAEPAPSPASPGGAGPAADAAAIRVRLRDGSSHTRRFAASDSLSLVYTWVDSLEAHASLRYSLVQSYPRVVLGRRRAGGEGQGRGGAAKGDGEDEATMSRSLEELELTPQAALFVQCGDDDEE